MAQNSHSPACAELNAPTKEGRPVLFASPEVDMSPPSLLVMVSALYDTFLVLNVGDTLLLRVGTSSSAMGATEFEGWWCRARAQLYWCYTTNEA